MMKLYGRPGLHDDWIRYQVEARKKRREEEQERKRKKAKNMEYFGIFLAAAMCVGGFILLFDLRLILSELQLISKET